MKKKGWWGPEDDSFPAASITVRTHTTASLSTLCTRARGRYWCTNAYCAVRAYTTRCHRRKHNAPTPERNCRRIRARTADDRRRSRHGIAYVVRCARSYCPRVFVGTGAGLPGVRSTVSLQTRSRDNVCARRYTP